MGNLDIHELVPDNFQSELIYPILEKLSISNDEGLWSFLELLNNPKFRVKLSDKQQTALKDIITRLEAIKKSTLSTTELINAFNNILDSYHQLRNPITAQIFSDISTLSLTPQARAQIPQEDLRNGGNTQEETPNFSETDTSWRTIITDPDGRVRNTNIRAVTWGAVVSAEESETEAPTTSTEISEPERTVDTEVAEVSNNNIENTAQDEIKTRLNRLSLYFETLKSSLTWDELGNLEIFLLFLEWVIEDIDRNFARKMTYPEFENQFTGSIHTIQEVASQVQSWTKFNELELTWLWNQELKDFLDSLSVERDKITLETLQKLEEQRNNLAPALWVGLDEVDETLENLTPYERVILLTTWLLPQDLANVENFNWDQMLQWDPNWFPVPLDLAWDIWNHNFYWDTARKMQELHQLTSIHSIAQIWENTFHNWAERMIWWEFINWYVSSELTPDDFQRYLDEINKWDFPEEVKMSALKILESFSGQIREQVDDLKDQLRAIRNGIDTNTMFMWEDMWTMEEKARAIATLLVLLEWVHQDLQNWWVIAFKYIANAILLWYSISELMEFEWLSQVLVSGLMFSPPLALTLISILAYKKSQKVKPLYRSFVTSWQNDIGTWARWQSNIDESMITRLETYQERRTIINNLITHLKQQNTNKARKQIKALESFRESRNMHIWSDNMWAMFLEWRVTRWNGKIKWGIHIIWRTQLTGGFNMLVRGPMNSFNETFEKWILKTLGLEHANFKELLDDDTLKNLSSTEATTIRDNAARVIDGLAVSEDQKEAKRILLRDYTRPLISKWDVIPERPFLYTISHIVDLWTRRTNIKQISENTPAWFDIEDARSRFENPNEWEIRLSIEKNKLLADIDGIHSPGWDNDTIKNKLRSKVSSIMEIWKLEQYEKDFVNPIRNMLSTTEGASIESIVRTEIEKGLNQSWSDPKNRITELSNEVRLERAMRSFVDSLDPNLKAAFNEWIRNAIISDTDSWKWMKALDSMKTRLRSMLQSVDGLDITISDKDAIKTSIADAVRFGENGLKSFDTIENWVKSVAELKVIMADTRNASIITPDRTTAINEAIAHRNWDQLIHLKSSITEDITRAFEIDKAKASAPPPMPWYPPAWPTPPPSWPAWPTPTTTPLDWSTSPETRETITIKTWYQIFGIPESTNFSELDLMIHQSDNTYLQKLKFALLQAELDWGIHFNEVKLKNILSWDFEIKRTPGRDFYNAINTVFSWNIQELFTRARVEASWVNRLIVERITNLEARAQILDAMWRRNTFTLEFLKNIPQASRR